VEFLLSVTIFLLLIILSGCFVIIKRLNTKNEVYEVAINDFYSSLSVVLHTMRVLDEKKIFEDDDEVGEVFSQLVDILSTLRPILYGIPNEKEEN
jgi:hypothetical protein